MNANYQFAIRNQTILFFQPLFGNIVINGRSSRWLRCDKGILCPPYLKMAYDILHSHTWNVLPLKAPVVATLVKLRQIYYLVQTHTQGTC